MRRLRRMQGLWSRLREGRIFLWLWLLRLRLLRLWLGRLLLVMGRVLVLLTGLPSDPDYVDARRS